MRRGKTAQQVPFPRCVFHQFPKDHEYIWQRVQRERKEWNRKYEGGMLRSWTAPAKQMIRQGQVVIYGA